MTIQYKVYTVAVLSAGSSTYWLGQITRLLLAMMITFGGGGGGDWGTLAQHQQTRSLTTAVIDPCSTKSGTSHHEAFCDKYYACVQNITKVMDCPNGLVYVGGGGRSGRGNSIFGNCEYDFNVECSSRPKRILAATSVSAQKKGSEQINPCDLKGNGKIIADVTYCDRYWECVNGQPELYDCPNGLAFAGRNRGVADGCDYPWRGNYCEGKKLANPPIGTEHCDWLYGIFGHETSCTRYWTCWNGTATEQLCIGGLLYNEDTHACDWPENVPGCQKHPLCKEDPNGNVPLGKSCNRYWSCQGGYPRLQRCPAMLVFDKKSLRCLVPPTEDCDIPSTPAPPPEEEEDKPRQQQGRPGKQGGGSRQQVQASQLRHQQQQHQQQQQQQQPQSEYQQNAASSHFTPQVYYPQQQELSEDQINYNDRAGGNSQF